MADEINDGGPAFPARRITHFNMAEGGAVEPIYQDDTGMSLRDWFAGQIIAAACVNAEGLGVASAKDRAEAFKGMTRIAYELADAAVTARDAK